jgi:CheY-like chemotaxis protein
MSSLFLLLPAVMLRMQVAEDNRINQKVLRMMLQANCAELTIVSDGQQAVDAFQTVRCMQRTVHNIALYPHCIHAYMCQQHNVLYAVRRTLYEVVTCKSSSVLSCCIAV